MKPFEGKSVTSAAIEIPSIAGGLRDAMKVSKVRHEPIDGDYLDGDQRRVHVLKAEAATLISAEDGTRLLADHKAKVAKAKEVAGQASFDDEDAVDDEDAAEDE